MANLFDGRVRWVLPVVAGVDGGDVRADLRCHSEFDALLVAKTPVDGALIDVISVRPFLARAWNTALVHNGQLNPSSHAGLITRITQWWRNRQSSAPEPLTAEVVATAWMEAVKRERLVPPPMDHRRLPRLWNRALSDGRLTPEQFKNRMALWRAKNQECECVRDDARARLGAVVRARSGSTDHDVVDEWVVRAERQWLVARWLERGPLTVESLTRLLDTPEEACW